MVSLNGYEGENTDCNKLAPTHANIYHQDLAQHIQLTSLLCGDIATYT